MNEQKKSAYGKEKLWPLLFIILCYVSIKRGTVKVRVPVTHFLWLLSYFRCIHNVLSGSASDTSHKMGKKGANIANIAYFTLFSRESAY